MSASNPVVVTRGLAKALPDGTYICQTHVPSQMARFRPCGHSSRMIPFSCSACGVFNNGISGPWAEFDGINFFCFDTECRRELAHPPGTITPEKCGHCGKDNLCPPFGPARLASCAPWNPSGIPLIPKARQVGTNQYICRAGRVRFEDQRPLLRLCGGALNSDLVCVAYHVKNARPRPGKRKRDEGGR